METIFSQITPQGRSGVAAFRISGPNALKTFSSINPELSLKPRYSHYCILKNPASNENIDHALVVFYPAPHSFTGEDVIEIFIHGSIAVCKMLYQTLSSIKGIRPAEAGEFSKRAVLNNKMNLTEAEGLADLIDAETSMQHKQAIRQMDGALQNIYDGWRNDLIKISGLLEAYIDFPDEDIPEAAINQAIRLIQELKAAISAHLDDNNRGERLRSGLYMIILGQPNVGKSSLMNFLTQRNVAITSEIAGTTRDVIETHLDIGGYPIILADSAGLRESADIIEQQGIAKAENQAKLADIKIIILDLTDLETSYKYCEKFIDNNTILVINKMDLIGNSEQFHASIPSYITEKQPIYISLKKQQDLQKLLNAIEDKASNIANPASGPAITRQRYRSNLLQALEALENCDIANQDLVLLIEDIRIATRALSIIIGKIDIEEILGDIFANFCIGK